MPRIAAVILAAGGSSRLGQPKQLLMFRGETLIRRAVRAATDAGCEPIVVVVGDNSDAIKLALDIRESRISSFSGAEQGARPTIVENGEWRRGLGTSIRCGVRGIVESSEAVVLLTCDQPLVDAAVIGELIAARERTGKPIVASRYANTCGVPALFDRSCFDALLALPDAAGAKVLIVSRPDDVATINFEGGAVDIDTPQDADRLTSL